MSDNPPNPPSNQPPAQPPTHGPSEAERKAEIKRWFDEFSASERTQPPSPSTSPPSSDNLEERFEAFLKRREASSKDAEERANLKAALETLTGKVDELSRKRSGPFSIFSGLH
jgi:hypothetical protein